MTPISLILPQSPSLVAPPPFLPTAHLKTRPELEKPAVMTSWLKQTLGQRFNPMGISSFADVVAKDPQLALPHISVPDIRHLDWHELRRLGFRGIVFDKDNTLTAPYSLSLWPALEPAFQICRSVFPGKIAVFSNSAGLCQYDPDGSEAKATEEAIGGIHVIRHELKKPGGTAEDIEKYFGCSASHLVMVGDRHFTDIVYGNRHGFLTVLTEPLSLSDDPFIVKQVRKLERYLVNRWCQQGLKPVKHNLLSQATHPVFLVNNQAARAIRTLAEIEEDGLF